MEEFMIGAIAMGSAIAALFFLRFWRETGDRLFFMFAISFLLLGITRLGLALSHDTVEGETHWYWVRLAAFVLILIAIVDKNRR
jgi:4-hydroxybenzoate polyprenyltransferase